MAPVFPLGFAAAALAYMNSRGFPVENVLYLYVLLALWDPWHFLMQHYGFTRIYDRYNAAPKKLAARMDLVLSATWFVFIMLASGEWLAGILEDLLLTAKCRSRSCCRAPCGGLTALALAATLATRRYGVYLAWCRRRGYFVSRVKLALFVTTFAVMFVAYTPNAWILSVGAGLDVQGRLRRDRHRTHDAVPCDRVALQPEPRRATGRARAGVFRAVHRRGGLFVAAAYVPCACYGAAHQRTPEPPADVRAARARFRFDVAALLLRRFHLEAASPQNRENSGSPRRVRTTQPQVVDTRARARRRGC